jgi:hypothetical protein
VTKFLLGKTYSKLCTYVKSKFRHVFWKKNILSKKLKTQTALKIVWLVEHTSCFLKTLLVALPLNDFRPNRSFYSVFFKHQRDSISRPNTAGGDDATRSMRKVQSTKYVSLR